MESIGPFCFFRGDQMWSPSKSGPPMVGSWEFSSEMLQEKPKDGQHGSPKSLFSASVWRLFWKMDSGGETR